LLTVTRTRCVWCAGWGSPAAGYRRRQTAGKRSAGRDAAGHRVCVRGGRAMEQDRRPGRRGGVAARRAGSTRSSRHGYRASVRLNPTQSSRHGYRASVCLNPIEGPDSEWRLAPLVQLPCLRFSDHHMTVVVPNRMCNDPETLIRNLQVGWACCRRVCSARPLRHSRCALA